MNSSWPAKQSHSCRGCYLKEAVHRPVPDSRLRWTLTNQILQVVLKALLVLQEAHGDVIIRFTLIQLGEQDPAGHTSCEEQARWVSKRQKPDTSSLVMEGFDVFNVPEDGFLLAADFRRRIWTVCKPHVMEGEEVDVFYKLGFPSYQVLDQLAGSMINLVL